MNKFLFEAFYLFLSLSVLQSQNLTPGFQFLGKGYDIFFSNLYDTSGNGDPGWKEQVFQFTTTQGLKTPDGLWVVPDYTTSTLLSACSIEQTETILNDGFDYQHSVSLGFDAELSLFNASFQFSIDSKHVVQTTISKESIYAQVESTCAAYQLNMNAYLTPNVTDEFQYGAETLTDTYDEDAYMTFVQLDSLYTESEIRWHGQIKAGINVKGSN